MNAFQLFITAIIAGAVLYFVGTFIAPLFSPTVDLGQETKAILVQAQADLGQTKSIFLSLKQGQTLDARNLDEQTRSVAFTCNGPECCPFIDNCKEPFSVTPERILVNQSSKTNLSARCQTVNQIHACKVYVGKLPGQVVLQNISIPDTLEINGKKTLNATGIIYNSGEVPASNIIVRLEMLQNQLIEETETLVVIDSEEETIETISAKGKTPLDLTILVQQPGNYVVRVIAQAEDAGFASEEKTLLVSGEPFSLCHRDLTKEESAYFDTFDNRCRKKVYCASCDFTYECRHAWQREAPVALPQFYDAERGEKTFTFLVYPDDDEQC